MFTDPSRRLMVTYNFAPGVLLGPFDLGTQSNFAELLYGSMGLGEALDELGFQEEKKKEATNVSSEKYESWMSLFDFLEGAVDFSELIARNADKINLTMGFQPGEEIDREGSFVLLVCDHADSKEDDTHIVFDQNQLNDNEPTIHVGPQANLVELTENFRDLMKAYCSLYSIRYE